MGKLYTVIEITAPNAFEGKALNNYIAVPCVIIEEVENENKTTTYTVAINIDDKCNKIPFQVNEKYLNVIQVSKVFTSLYDCKKEANLLNDELIREYIKNCSLSTVRELSKLLRQNLNYAENLQNSVLSNNEIVR